MKSSLTIGWSIIIFLSLLTIKGYSQKITCEVKVTLEKMPLENQDKLSFLQNELGTYINSYDWTENEYGYELACQMEIAFDEVKIVNYEDRYTATIIVSNGVDLQFADKRWVFALAKGERLNHTSSFHSFTSLIDFYFDLILAHEFDKLNRFGGDKYLDAAKVISESAKFSTQYYRGWDRRNELVIDLASENNKPCRLIQFHTFYGNYYYEAEDRENAAVHYKYAVSLLNKIPPDKRERYYELYYLTLSRALKEMQMTAELDLLNSLKPQ